MSLLQLWWHNKKILGDAATLSDIMFLAKKEFDGKLVHDEGTVTTAVDVATLTANTGKDMYLAKAHVIAVANGAGNGTATIELSANGSVIGTCSFDLNHSATPDSGNSTHDYEFSMSGNKVTTGQIIKIAVTAISDLSIDGELGRRHWK